MTRYAPIRKAVDKGSGIPEKLSKDATNMKMHRKLLHMKVLPAFAINRKSNILNSIVRLVKKLTRRTYFNQ
jgi:hypothetical protein